MTAARASVRPVVRRQWRLEWEYDSIQTGADGEVEPFRRKRVRYVSNAVTAYRMAAVRLIVAKGNEWTVERDERGRPSRCLLCEAFGDTPYGDEAPRQCKYHWGEGFYELRDRLARWLRWRDKRAAELDEARQ